MHMCPSDCLFPVQNETLSPQNPLTRASGVRLILAGHRRNRQHWGLHREQGRSHHRDNGGILGLGKLELAERKTPWEGGALGQSMARGLERFPSTWLGTAQWDNAGESPAPHGSPDWGLQEPLTSTWGSCEPSHGAPVGQHRWEWSHIPLMLCGRAWL